MARALVLGLGMLWLFAGAGDAPAALPITGAFGIVLGEPLPTEAASYEVGEVRRYIRPPRPEPRYDRYAVELDATDRVYLLLAVTPVITAKPAGYGDQLLEEISKRYGSPVWRESYLTLWSQGARTVTLRRMITYQGEIFVLIYTDTDLRRLAQRARQADNQDSGNR